MIRLSIIVLTVALAGCYVAGAGPTVATTRTVPDDATEIRTLVELINDHRRTVGCKPLIWNDAAARVAEQHSADMVRRNFFSHTNPDDESPFDRMRSADIVFRRGAENIAAGQRTGPEVFRSWISSAGHRRNIENCDLREHGIGLVRGTPTAPYGAISNAWTHLFFAP